MTQRVWIVTATVAGGAVTYSDVLKYAEVGRPHVFSTQAQAHDWVLKILDEGLDLDHLSIREAPLDDG